MYPGKNTFSIRGDVSLPCRVVPPHAPRIRRRSPIGGEFSSIDRSTIAADMCCMGRTAVDASSHPTQGCTWAAFYIRSSHSLTRSLAKARARGHFARHSLHSAVDRRSACGTSHSIEFSAFRLSPGDAVESNRLYHKTPLVGVILRYCYCYCDYDSDRGCFCENRKLF